jgi:hypothetical protein
MDRISLTRRALLALLGTAPALAAAAPRMIDDFSGDAAARWRFFSDQVMGGVSTGQVRFGPGVLRLSGTVSTANNGGFLQARRDLPEGLQPDVSAITARVRGNAQRYFIHLRTAGMLLPGQYLQAGFIAGPDWQDITLPLAEFTPSGALVRRNPAATSIRSVALVAYGQDYEADVEISRIGTA